MKRKGGTMHCRERINNKYNGYKEKIRFDPNIKGFITSWNHYRQLYLIKYWWIIQIKTTRLPVYILSLFPKCIIDWRSRSWLKCARGVPNSRKIKNHLLCTENLALLIVDKNIGSTRKILSAAPTKSKTKE